MSQIVCPRCSAKGFLLTISRSAGIDELSSGDPTGTLECPGCHTTMEFRAHTLPIFPHPAIHYPLQRFKCREYVGMARSLYGGRGHMLPSDNGEWVRHADHVEAVEKAGRECELSTAQRENAYLQKQLTTLRAEKDTLHAQWERQKGTISYLSEEVDELKNKLQVAESQKNQAAMDVAREKRDRWMRGIREYNAMPMDAFQQAMQPGRIFYQPFPSHAEVTIRSLNERILKQEKVMTAVRRMYTAVVEDLTIELAACRFNLKAAEQERDAEKLKLQKFREVLIGLTF